MRIHILERNRHLYDIKMYIKKYKPILRSVYTFTQ